MQLALSTSVVALAALIGTAVGETHIVSFNNLCGCGTPRLVQGGDILSNGSQITIFGPLISAIAYLQTGECLLNGENCTLIETVLENLSDGNNSGSQTDITVQPPHKLNVAVRFNYFNGCDGQGASCNVPNCTPAPVSCQVDNVGLNITFCPN